MSVLTIKNLNYKYEDNKNPTLININGEFEPGKLYSIVGKSGSGKSTLLSLIAGLDVINDGEILFNGENINNLNKDRYRAEKIGVIFQGFNLLNTATALENIILSMNISKVKVSNKKEYALKILESVGIDKVKANRKILHLSGGEQQRIGIARALAHNPEIIIADEPTGNLDSENEAAIMEIFKDLVQRENKCIIVVTHSRKVSSFANEILGMEKGKLMFIK